MSCNVETTFMILDSFRQNACVRITGDIPNKLNFTPYECLGHEELSNGIELLIVNMTTTKIVLHNIPRVCYAWDFVATQKTQRTEAGSSITIPYQARQNGSKWLSRWEESRAFDTTEFDMVIFLFDTPPSTQLYEVGKYFNENKTAKNKPNYRHVLWRREGKYIQNSENIWDSTEVGPPIEHFSYFSPSLDVQGFSTYFSTIFGSVCYEEDLRKQRNITVSLPKDINVPEKMMCLVYKSSMVDSVTIGRSSGTMKFRVQEGQGKWQITFICKCPRGLYKGVRVDPQATDVLRVQMLGQIVQTAEDQFDPALIYQMACMSTTTFVSILVSYPDLKDIYMNCIYRGNATWTNAFQTRQLETHIPQILPGLAPMRTHSCMPPPPVPDQCP